MWSWEVQNSPAIQGIFPSWGNWFWWDFPPITKLTSIKIILFIIIVFDLEVEQMDIKRTFLYVDLEEEIYIEQWKDFTISERISCFENKKSPTLLKQSLRMWYEKLTLIY